MDVKTSHFTATANLSERAANREDFRPRPRIRAGAYSEGLARQTAHVSFPFRFAEDDQRDLRWYLEDYLQFPEDPAPKIAARVEGRMAALGAGEERVRA